MTLHYIKLARQNTGCLDGVYSRYPHYSMYMQKCTNKHAYIHKYKQTDRQTDRHTSRHKNGNNGNLLLTDLP